MDTSAILAFLDADEKRHAKAVKAWNELLDGEATLFCTNYVLVETFALVQNRLGLEAVRALAEVVVPLLEVQWVDEEVHRAAVSALLAASRRGLSLVDASSFEVMRRLGLSRAFALDAHFTEQGFEVTP